MRTFFFLIAGAIALVAADTKGEKEVMATLDTFRHAFLKKDTAALAKMVHEDLLYTHSSGAAQSKAEFLKAVTGGADYARFDFTANWFHVYGNTAMMQGSVDLRRATAPNEAAPLTVLMVWMKNGQGWQLVARQAMRPAPPAAPKK